MYTCICIQRIRKLGVGQSQKTQFRYFGGMNLKKNIPIFIRTDGYDGLDPKPAIEATCHAPSTSCKIHKL